MTYADVQGFLKTAVTIFGGIICLIGAMDAFSGYSNQSSGKQSEGFVKLAGGAAIIIIGTAIVDKMFVGL